MRSRAGLRNALIATGLLIGAGALLPGGAADAQPDESRCSNRTLRGGYGGSFDGQVPAGPNTLLLRGLVLTHFDGRGHLSQLEFATINGTPPPGGEWVSTEGTYHLDSNCTGTAEILQSNGTVLRQRWVVVNHGREIRAIVEGAVAGGTRIKVD